MSAIDLDRLAAEHVLGLLEGEEAATAEKLFAQDLEFSGLVGAWRVRLSELDDIAPQMAPSDALWSRIEAGLSPLAAPVAAPVNAGLAARLNGLWSSLGFWRGAGLAAAFASVVLALGLGLSMRELTRKPVLIAVLMNDANRPAAIVNVLADGNAELVPIDSIAVPPGRALQIWTLWDRARGPVSVGLIKAAQRVPLRLENLPRTVTDQIFEISLEPESGSPTGRPTGPVLMKGTANTAL